MYGFEDVERAKATFETLCKAFDSKNLIYEKEEGKMTINCKAQGNDLPMELSVSVDSKRMVVVVVSKLPLTIKEEKRLDAAVAICTINNMLCVGSFDYDIITGKVFFCITNSIIESTLSEAMLLTLLMTSFKTIDDFNDKLMMLGSGMTSLDQFLTSILN